MARALPRARRSVLWALNDASQESVCSAGAIYSAPYQIHSLIYMTAYARHKSNRGRRYKNEYYVALIRFFSSFSLTYWRFIGSNPLVSAAQALTTFRWIRLSDTVGRKPVILIGLFGVSISMYSFGVSRTFLAVVVSRSPVILNESLVIMKSMVAELTDETNIACGYASQPIAWSVAEAIGQVYLL